jgi:hypothetical protein
MSLDLDESSRVAARQRPGGPFAMKMGEPNPIRVAQLGLRHLAGQFDGASPIPHGLSDLDPVTHRLSSERPGCQPFKSLIGSVEKARLEEVLRQLVESLFTQFGVEVSTAQKVLVDPDGPIGLAPASKQFTERKVQFDGLGVDPNDIDECVHRTVGLIVEEKVQAPKICIGKRGTHRPRTRLMAGCQPPQSKKKRKGQQPENVEFHDPGFGDA